MITRTSTTDILSQIKPNLTLDIAEKTPKKEVEISQFHGELYQIDLSSPKKSTTRAITAETVVIDERNIMPEESKEKPAETSNNCCLIM